MFSQIRKKQKPVSMFLAIIFSSSWLSLACQSCFASTDPFDESISTMEMPCHQNKISQIDHETNIHRDVCEKQCERIHTDVTLEIAPKYLTINVERIILDDVSAAFAFDFSISFIRAHTTQYDQYGPPGAYSHPLERYDVLII